MNININRQPSAKDWTLSSFLSDCQTVKGVGVEDEKREVKVKGETRIPAGVYNLILTYSPKFSKEYYRDQNGEIISAKEWNGATPEVKNRYKWQHELITVENVKDFLRILFHWGNTDLDTDGCYVVGSVFGKTGGRDGVLNSRKKYTEVYPLIWRAIHKGKVTATYIDNEK